MFDSLQYDTCEGEDCQGALTACIDRTYAPKLDVAKGLMIWDDIDSDGLCDRCKEVAQMDFEASRDTLWIALPSVFGLPPWNALDGGHEDED